MGFKQQLSERFRVPVSHFFFSSQASNIVCAELLFNAIQTKQTTPIQKNKRVDHSESEKSFTLMEEAPSFRAILRRFAIAGNRAPIPPSLKTFKVK